MVHQDPAVNLFRARYSNVHLLTAPQSLLGLRDLCAMPSPIGVVLARESAVHLTIYTILVVSPDSADERKYSDCCS